MIKAKDLLIKYQGRNLIIDTINSELKNTLPLNLKTRLIAQKAFTSTSAITRFFQKEGWKSFTLFKYVLEYENSHEYINQNLEESKSFKHLVNSIIENIWSLNTTHSFFTWANKLVNCQGKIIIVGFGSSFISALSLQHNLTSMGIVAQSLNDIHIIKPLIKALAHDDLLIIISKSGQTKEIRELIDKNTINKNYYAITSNQDSILYKNAIHSILTTNSPNLSKVLSIDFKLAVLIINFVLSKYIMKNSKKNYNFLKKNKIWK